MKGCSSEKERQSKALGAVLHTFFAAPSSRLHAGGLAVGSLPSTLVQFVYHDAENRRK
jgi:hypothetical protein